MSTLSSTFHIESPCTYYGSSIYAARQVSGAVSTFPCLTYSKYCPSNDVLRCFGPCFFRNEPLSTPRALVFLLPIEEMWTSCSRGLGMGLLWAGAVGWVPLCAHTNLCLCQQCPQACCTQQPLLRCPPAFPNARRNMNCFPEEVFSTVVGAVSTQVKFLLLSCITFNYPHHPKNIPQLPSGQNYAYF